MKVFSLAEKAANDNCPIHHDGRHMFTESDSDLGGPLYPCACGKKAPPNDPEQGVCQYEKEHIPGPVDEL